MLIGAPVFVISMAVARSCAILSRASIGAEATAGVWILTTFWMSCSFEGPNFSLRFGKYGFLRSLMEMLVLRQMWSTSLYSTAKATWQVVLKSFKSKNSRRLNSQLTVSYKCSFPMR